MIIDALRRLQRLDQSRESFPGEHWAAFGGGLTLLQCSRRARAPWLRTAAGLAGVLLVVRAASGRDGLWAQLRRQRRGGEAQRLPDGAEQRALAAPEPYRFDALAPSTPARVDMADEAGLRFWRQRFGVTTEQLAEAVLAVGGEPDAVQEHLLNQGSSAGVG